VTAWFVWFTFSFDYLKFSLYNNLI
jgi:hypothetical protein